MNSQNLWRVQSLESKEPDTFEWIFGFKTDDVLLDVGASAGIYTIWAAMTTGGKVCAFEPEAQNYALLKKYIIANRLTDRVTAYAVALSDITGFGDLYLSTILIGGFSKGFDQGLGAPSYSTYMTNVKLALAPGGNAAETIRFCDALECGTLPMVVDELWRHAEALSSYLSPAAKAGPSAHADACRKWRQILKFFIGERDTSLIETSLAAI